MDPTCLVSTVQAGGAGLMSWARFLGIVWVPSINHGLNTTVYLSIVAEHVHPFMVTVHRLLTATSSRIMSQSKSCLKLVS